VCATVYIKDDDTSALTQQLELVGTALDNLSNQVLNIPQNQQITIRNNVFEKERLLHVEKWKLDQIGDTCVPSPDNIF
jgi:hypothetical protein